MVDETMDEERPEPAEPPSASQPVRVFAAVARTFGFLASNIPALLLMTAVVAIPVVLYQSSFLERAQGGMSDAEYRTMRLGLTGLYMLLLLVLQAAATLAVFQHLQGRPVHVLASIRRGLVALLPIVVMALVLFFLSGLAMAVASSPLRKIADGSEQDALIWAARFGVPLAILTWISSVHFVCTQALVVEKLGPIAALRRSQALTVGARWRIAGLLLAVLGVRWLLTRLLYPAVIDTEASWDAFELAHYVDAAINSLFVVFLATCCAVMYCDLRRAKDGLDIEELARVFEE